MSKEIAEEYASSLSDLTVNSKPLINMLTILAEENSDHAGVIVETVEKHLEKVNPDIKLPVLYLVDSIIKNVGGAYTTKFSQSIVNMFTRTFKQVDEKIRSQMFKLRETWHDVFPATKLYQLDVKVNLIDPAWPIQAQPQQTTIHVNPNFLKKTATTSVAPLPAVTVPVAVPNEDEKMRSIVAKKEKELLMLQKKTVEMELEKMRRQLELDKTKKITRALSPKVVPPVMPVALVSPVVVPPAPAVEVANIPVKQRLGPPVNKPAGAGRIAPVSGALAAARRDPRLARRPPPAPAPAPSPAPPIAPNVFDIKPLERGTKRKNVITFDVRPDAARPRDPRADKRERRRDTRARRHLDRDERRPAPAPPAPAPPAPPADPKQRDKKNDAEAAERVDEFIGKLQVADPKKINRLPPIPKIVRDDRPEPPAPKRKKELARERKKKRDDADGKDSSEGSSPEKKLRSKELKKKREPRAEAEPERADDEVVAFKALKNYHKERYRERNREKSESPEKAPAAPPANVPEVVETKDVDLRVLPAVEPKPAPVTQKRSSTEALEGKPKKNKIDKFDILFGNEDVDLRQLPLVDEIAAPPPPTITDSPKKSPKTEPKPTPMEEENPPQESPLSPEPEPEAEAELEPDLGSPKKDWNEVKEKKEKEDVKKTPSKLDLAKAKLAEMTRTKDRLGRPLLFSKSPSIEKERRRTLSSTEDTDMREGPEEFDAEDHKKTINIIMSQAKEQFTDGKLDKSQYNALMFQVLQLNEKLKLKEAKQRESLEVSKRKLKAHTEEEHRGTSPRNRFGDIDERTPPSALADSDMRNAVAADMRNAVAADMRNVVAADMRNAVAADMRNAAAPPRPPRPFGNVGMPFPPFPAWRPHPDEFGPRRFRGPAPFFRAAFEPRGPRGPFDVPRLPPPLPPPQAGTWQGACPLRRYERARSPPPLGAPPPLPPPDPAVVDYVDRDPVKTIQIDGVPREIRFYGDTAVIMLDWDDPREIRFLPGCRRVTFDDEDSVVLAFDEGYKRVEIEDQAFDIKFGAPTRELYVNGRWHECAFGGGPLGVLIDGKPRLVHLEGPPPQVDIGKDKRTDLVAGKINIVVNATRTCPVYLDAKVQKFTIDEHVLTVRFVDALRTVLINERPFKVEFGDLPRPIFLGNEKHFIRFTSLPRGVKPGFVRIADMEGSATGLAPPAPLPRAEPGHEPPTEPGHEPPTKPGHEPSTEPDRGPPRPSDTPSPDLVSENQGLDMLASVMPTSTELAPGSDYSLAEPLLASDVTTIPGLEAPAEEKPTPAVPSFGNINITDLFAKLVATGIVQVTGKNDVKVDKVEDVKNKQREDKSVIHKVDLLRPETLRKAQWGIVCKLYGGMQCSGCGSRFPPEQTVRYSQHLDWHFRQNRRERDSARRAHSRHWHYDLSDWLQYEEVDELDDREKNWFESGAEEGEAPPEAPTETPSVAAGAPADAFCALCGDKFHQFYNEDQEEWHLRNSVRHEDQNYHPMCFDDYKASLTKEEPIKESTDDVVAMDKTEEAIEIKDVEDELDDQSDNESVVEVVEEKPAEPVEIDEGEEDDVIYKAEPVVEVVVEDEADTDDETCERRAERDRRAAEMFANVKVKQEPVDPDDEPIITAEEESILPSVETNQTNHVTVLSSIDGNVQLDAAPAPVASLGGIRINISKTTIPTFISTAMMDPMLDDISADDEPLPPGEEPELEYKLKPALEDVQFSRQPPLSKGNELSGLCSIM